MIRTLDDCEDKFRFRLLSVTLLEVAMWHLHSPKYLPNSQYRASSYDDDGFGSPNTKNINQADQHTENSRVKRDVFRLEKLD